MTEKDELRDPGVDRPPDEEAEGQARRRHYARPSVDIYATETEMVVLADLPGVKKSDLDITLERDELIIEAKVEGREKQESKLPWGYHRRFKLRTPFERDRIRASLEGGILHITLPKSASERAKKVEVV